MFEPLVYPQILFRVLADIMLNGLVDAGGIGFFIAAGETVEWRAEFDLVSTSGQAIMRTRDHGGLAHLGDAAGGGDGGGGNAEERHEHRVGGAVVLVRRIPDNFAAAQQAQHLPYIGTVYGAANVVTAPPVDKPVDNRVVIGAVDRMDIHQGGQHSRACIQGVEMHAEQQYALAPGPASLDMLHAGHGKIFIQVDAVIIVTAGHFQDRLAGADHAAVGQRVLFFRSQLREAKSHVGLGNMAPFFCQVPRQAPHASACGL